MRHKLLIYLAIFGLFFSIVSISYCADKKVSKKAETKKVEEKKDQIQELASVIHGLRIEVLNWQKKYYIEVSNNMQLRAMNNLWQTPEFVNNYKQILDTDKTLKQQQLVGGEIK